MWKKDAQLFGGFHMSKFSFSIDANQKRFFFPFSFDELQSYCKAKKKWCNLSMHSTYGTDRMRKFLPFYYFSTIGGELVMLAIHAIQARLREAASLEKHVLLKKLRDALESLKGRVAGRNKDDVEDAIAMVSILYPIPFYLIVLLV